MADSNQAPANGEPAPVRRPRAPTITIDTAINPNDGSQAAAPGASGNSPVSPQEEGVSPATTTASELRGTTSFDSKDSRPTSPHNVSSALAPRAPERQPTVEAELARVRRCVPFGGLFARETIVAALTNTPDPSKKRQSSEFSNDKIMNDENALTPDQGREEDFTVDNNPFAFTPAK
ncbi:unnamed protein product [Parascedosporium putredinis]|uniref:Uncharacterized protein n=1 Tax=Parascedosporium putredinis TaxID=1442378 RepID=A0A9P1HD63_9PEZI|nr:unnamed protein product [Parascedosporium putredinis]CAI8005126.1 unnamed protein product [Parascedosporium putredinis]